MVFSKSMPGLTPKEIYYEIKLVMKYLHVVSLWWNNYWFRPANRDPLIFYRFLIFFVGPIYIFFIPMQHPPSFYEQWQPISFYQFFAGPLEPSVLISLKYIWIVFSLAAGLNLFFSITAKIAAACAIIYVGHSYNFGHVYHGTHLYVMVMSILSFSRLDRFDEKHPSHRWPIAFCAFYVVYTMFFCGLQKLYYGDGLRWFFSESFYLRLFTNPYSPPLNQWIIQSPMWVSQTMAFWGLLITEVFTPFYLFRKSTRYLIFVIWTGFHIMVMLSFGSHKSFVTQVLCYFAILPMEDWLSFLTPLNKKLLFHSAFHKRSES